MKSSIGGREINFALYCQYRTNIAKKQTAFLAYREHYWVKALSWDCLRANTGNKSAVSVEGIGQLVPCRSGSGFLLTRKPADAGNPLPFANYFR